MVLKDRLNYYYSHHLSPPLALSNEFNHINQLITTKSLYLPEHPHYGFHNYENTMLNGNGYEAIGHYDDAVHSHYGHLDDHYLHSSYSNLHDHFYGKNFRVVIK